MTTRAAVPALLALAIAAAYARTLGVPFLFDDWHVIVQNPAIRSLAFVPRFFVDPRTATVIADNQDLRPLLMASFALNFAVSGLAPWSWHVVNLLFHWTAAVLVLRIVRDHLWVDARVALFAALVVALHPLCSSAVNYVSARSALLTTVFYLAAFDAALHERRYLALGLFAAALATKAIAVTWPIVLVVHALLRRERDGTPPRWDFVAVAVAVAVAGTFYRVAFVPIWVLDVSRRPDVSRWEYLLTGWSAYVHYLRLFLWPNALVIDRFDFPIVRSLAEPRAWGSFAIVGGLGAAAWATRRRVPALAFATALIVVTLAPETLLFSLGEAVNEHRPYLAMLGFATLAGLALDGVARAVARVGGAGRAVVIVATVVTLVLGAATAARNETWRDEYGFWLDATKKAPANPRVWQAAGEVALERGRLDEAARLFAEADRLHPCGAPTLLGLSRLAVARGDLGAALVRADAAVECVPRLEASHVQRADVLERRGRIDDAIAALARATALDDRDARAWQAEGRLLERRERWREAAAAYDHALAVDPTRVDAAMPAGLLYHYRLQDPLRAVDRYAIVLRLVPAHYGAHYQLAMALLAAGRVPEAQTAWAAFVPMAEAHHDQASLAAAPPGLRTPRP